MVHWGFYGRANESRDLALRLGLDPNRRRRRFGTYTILGRRGVGKTRLLHEVCHDRDPAIPFLHVELPSGDAAACLEALADQVQYDGLSPLLEDMPRLDGSYSPGFRFTDIVRQLLMKGAIVALDEFHHAAPAGIVPSIKYIIDEIRRMKGEPPSGKLVLMGSHQQQMLHMFRVDQPLHGRSNPGVQVRPWPVETVLEMASDQGFLRHPGRFLTLWTAWDGLPRPWERFTMDDEFEALRDFEAWPDDDVWRRAFIESECRILQEDPRERFDSKAYVELADRARRAILWLAGRGGRGERLREFPEVLRNWVPDAKGEAPEPLEAVMGRLRDHLEMVTPQTAFPAADNRSRVRWGLRDNSALFQLGVFPELFGGEPTDDNEAAGRATVDIDRALSHLHTLEGFALERFAADWFRTRPETEYAASGAWRPGRGNLPDIDVLVVDDGDPPLLTMAGCKRNASRHKCDKLKEDFQAFLHDIRGTSKAHLADLPRRQLLISPAFSDEEERRYAGEGFGCLDIPAMARAMGLETAPPREEDRKESGRGWTPPTPLDTDLPGPS